MDILVIGNGFDLAHGLPTKYTDFLKWVVGQYKYFYTLKEQYAQITKSREHITLKIPEIINGILISERVEHQEEIWNCIDDNAWIEYFLQNPMFQKENWIDFESEISHVIRSLDDDLNMINGQRLSLDNIMHRISNEFLHQKYSDWLVKRTYRELRDTLLCDLYKLIRALEIYLCEYVDKIKIKLISPDIQEIIKNQYSTSMSMTSVINFNYTNTYGKLYLFKPNPDKPEKFFAIPPCFK